MWRGCPSPITAKEPADFGKAGWDPRGKVYSVVSTDKGWEQVEGAYTSATNPTGDRDGNVFFADPAANRIALARSTARTSARAGRGGSTIAAASR